MKTAFFVSLLGANVLALVAPKIIAPSAEADFIDGRYIIQLKPGTSADAIISHHNTIRSLLRRRDGSRGAVEKTFKIGEDFNAYSGTFDDATLAAISELDEVLSIEHDQVIRIARTEDTPAILSERNLTTQAHSTWNLGDLSHREAGAKEYVYDESAGEGTTAYVLDTGIRLSHNEFEGRASFGINALTGSTTPYGTNSDTLGHGTHVAAIIAGKTYGVAKKAKVIDVKMFEGSRSTAGALLLGIDWAVKDITAKGAEKRSVLNMSFSGKITSSVDNAVIAAYNLGILSVAAAGNNHQSAAKESPARCLEVLTVGMTDSDRSRHSRSNYGPVVDVFAPGYDITSASYISDSSTRKDSGTSMSAPLVAGLVCYLRALEGGLGTPKAVTNRIRELAIPYVVKDAKGSPNLLVNNGSGR